MSVPRPDLGASDLHGSAPDKCAAALLLIDVINDLQFEGAEALLQDARAMAPRLAALKARAKQAGIPVIYVNDNFGRWQSNFQAQLAHCLEDGVRGQEIVAQLQPDEDDYFVLKPKHSGFFSTTLDTLLRYLGTRRLVLTGMTTDVCVLFTANDAYMRDFELVVPSDCLAAIDQEKARFSLHLMEKTLKARLVPSTDLDLEDLLRTT